MRKSKRSVIILCLLSFTLAGAEIYKWVDENGVIHYTDKPPRDQQSTDVDVQSEYRNGERKQGESVYQDVIEQQRARRELRAKQHEQEASERKAEQQKEATSEANCARAIHYLNTLKRQCPVFYDGAGIMRAQCPGYYYAYEGDRTYIEDNERAQLIEHFRKIVGDCSEQNR